MRASALRRRLLLSTTALLALAAVEARTQSLPTPSASPAGGQVVAGQASIAQGANRTTIRQSTDRAAIDWQRFDVGRDHTVRFEQPSAGSWTLNRVTGPDPSVIAGRVLANGGVALVNPSGVLFAQGSQVDVGSLIATPSDITNQDFMAGRMRFEGTPRPGARVENQGEITVADRGLVALAGPRAANSGIIRARMGRVAMAGGAEGVTVDLAGDGLLALDVTRSTRQGTGGVALLTNSGVVDASGGSVALTAHAASGLVEDLVHHTGSATASRIAIRAEGGNAVLAGTLAARATTGAASVEATARGGAVRVAAPAGVSAEGATTARVQLGGATTRRVQVDGQVAARGANGQRGGRIAAQASDSVAVGAGARLDASAPAGGGEVLVGTTGQGRAQTMARTTTIAAGAAIAADATAQGHGGTVLVNSTERTEMRGTLSARGAGQGGDGGFAEISGQGRLVLPDLASQVDLSPGPGGRPGTLLLDPRTITIVADEEEECRYECGYEGEASFAALSLGGIGPLPTGDVAAGDPPEGLILFASQVGGTTANLVLEATDTITVAAAVTKPQGDLTLRTTTVEGSGILVNAGLTLGAGATLTLETPLAIRLDAPIAAPNLVLNGATGIFQAATGAAITADRLSVATGAGVAAALGGAGNAIGTLAGADVGGQLRLASASGDLVLDGVVKAGTLRLELPAGDVTQTSGRVITGQLSAGLGTGRSLTLTSTENRIAALGPTQAPGGSIHLVTGGPLSLAGTIDTGAEGTIRLGSAGDISPGIALVMTAGTLRFDVTAGSVKLGGAPIAFRRIGRSDVAGALELVPAGSDTTDLVFAGPVQADSIRINRLLFERARTITQAEGATITTNALSLAAGAGVRLDDPANAIRALGVVTANSTSPLFPAGQPRVSVTTSTALELIGQVVVPTGDTRLAAAGDITQAAGSDLRVGTLLLTAPNAWLTLPGNVVTGLGASQVEGDLALRTSTALAITGPVQATLLDLASGGTIQQQPGARLDVETLAVSATGAALFEEPTNIVRGLGEVSVAAGGVEGSRFSLTTTTALEISGPLTSADVTLVASGTVRQVGAAEPTEGGSVVTLHEGPGICACVVIATVATSDSSAGGPITAGSLVVRAPEAILDHPDNAIAALGRAGAGGSVVVPGTLRVVNGTGGLRFDGPVTAGTLEVTAPGDITQAARADSVVTATMARLVSTGGSVVLDAGDHGTPPHPGNAIQQIGGSAAGDFVLVNGPTTDPFLSLVVAETLSAGNVRLAGPGSVTQAAPLLVRGTLNLRVGTAVALELAENRVATLGASSAGGSFSLRTGETITLRGAISGGSLLRVFTDGGMVIDGAALSGPRIEMAARGGTLALNAATITAREAALFFSPLGITAGGQTRALRDPAAAAPGVMVFDTRANGLPQLPEAVRPDLAVADAEQPTQLATFAASLAFAGPAGGNIALDLADAGSVFLLLGNGAATGTLHAQRLGVQALGGAALLTGSIAGDATGTAAQRVAITAQPSGAARGAYTFNACVMGLATCTVPNEGPEPSPEPPPAPNLPFLIVSVQHEEEREGDGNPSQAANDILDALISPQQPPRQPDDLQVLPPGIGTQDF